MIKEIKSQLRENPEAIQSLLEFFDFAHINIRGNSIRFARSEDGGQNISINLNDEYLNVTDFVQGYHTDIITYIIKEKRTDFKSVLTEIKRELHLSDDWRPAKSRSIFGGVYDSITKKTYVQPKTYDENILSQYLSIPNKRFFNDNISLETQMEWDIGYDVETDRITFPIRDQYGSIIGIKGRRNYETDNESDPKYLYIVPCRMSSTLFGFSENYRYMYGGTVMVFESEKSVLQCASYGYRNAVAIGSNSLSELQAKLILQLNPERVIFMLDDGLPLENTMKDIETLKSACSMRNLQISYFDWEDCIDLPSKSSPSDEGKEILDNILEENIKEYEDDEL